MPATRTARTPSVPYPKTRYRVAALLGEDESYLWPEVTDRTALARAELVNIWPRRGDVPAHLWDELQRTDEAAQVAWVEPSDLDRYEIHPTIRLRIDHGLTSSEPYLG